MKKLIRWIRQSDRIEALEKDLKSLKLTLAEDLRSFLREFEPRMDKIEKKTGLQGLEIPPPTPFNLKAKEDPSYKLVTFKFMKEYVEKAVNQKP